MNRSTGVLEQPSTNERDITENRTLKIYVFYCLSHLEASGTGLLEGIVGLKLIPVPCAGKIDIRYLVKAFETGADGVALVSCPEGDCRYLEGNRRARKRMEAVEALLVEAGLGKGRLRVIQLDEAGASKVVREIGEFTQWLQGLPAAAPAGPAC
jgi:F420-non-reducing hydrogenase iron-sulfur subunit